MTAIQQYFHVEQPYVDPYWAYVRTLLHFNGNTLDESTSNVSYNLANGAVIAAPGALHGGGCLDTTAGTDARCGGSSAALALGTGAFCIELWFKDIIAVQNNQYIFLIQNGGNSQTVRMYAPTWNGLSADCSGAGPGSGFVPFVTNTWNHAAITRNGNDWTLWINGQVGLTWFNNTFNGGVGATSLWIGCASSLGTGLTGQFDSFRLTVGVPRYTVPFNPMGYWPNRGP